MLLRHVDLTLSFPCLKSRWSPDSLTEHRVTFMTWLLLPVPAQFIPLPVVHSHAPYLSSLKY